MKGGVMAEHPEIGNLFRRFGSGSEKRALSRKTV
jgi:hypothetical protein